MSAGSHPRLPGRLAEGAELADALAEPWRVVQTREVYRSGYLDADLDTIRGPNGEEADRIVIRPRGAVAILPVDEDGRVLLLRQYRHAIGGRVLEIPAGTLDVEGEDPLDAARRELAEEADLNAGSWTKLGEAISSPGYTTERMIIYRASDLEPVPEGERYERQGEEASLEQWWISLDEALAAIEDGRLCDATAQIALLTHARGIVGP